MPLLEHDGAILLVPASRLEDTGECLFAVHFHQKDAACLQGAVHVGSDPAVILGIFEVTERGEHVDDGTKGIRPAERPHVFLHKLDIKTLFPGLLYSSVKVGPGAVNAGDLEAPAGKLTATVKLDGAIRGLRHLRFKIECGTSGDVRKSGLNDLRIDTIFQHNMFARPYLLGGSNEVTVATGGESVEGREFTVTYLWKEGNVLRTHTQGITTSPQTYTINVAAGALLQMISLEMAVAR